MRIQLGAPKRGCCAYCDTPPLPPPHHVQPLYSSTSLHPGRQRQHLWLTAAGRCCAYRPQRQAAAVRRPLGAAVLHAAVLRPRQCGQQPHAAPCGLCCTAKAAAATVPLLRCTSRMGVRPSAGQRQLRPLCKGCLLWRASRAGRVLGRQHPLQQVSRAEEASWVAGRVGSGQKLRATAARKVSTVRAAPQPSSPIALTAVREAITKPSATGR